MKVLSILKHSSRILFGRVSRHVRKSTTSGFSKRDLIHVSQSFPELLINGSGTINKLKLLFMIRYIKNESDFQVWLHRA